MAISTDKQELFRKGQLFLVKNEELRISITLRMKATVLPERFLGSSADCRDNVTVKLELGALLSFI